MKLIFKIITYWLLAEVLLLILAFCLMWNGDSFKSALGYMPMVTVDLLDGWRFHTAGALTSGLIWLFLYFKKIYRAQGLKLMSKKLALYFLIPIGLLFTSFKALDWYRYSDTYEWEKDESVFNHTGKVADRYSKDGKIRGMHTFGRGQKSDEGLNRLVSDNVEWITHVPYAYQRTTNTIDIRHSKKDSLGQWTRRDSSFILLTKKASARGLRTIMKPHLWMSNAGSDEWRNAINFSSEADWKAWETNYRNMILHYAQMAAEFDMPMLCIGVEMKSTVRAREGFWRGLIRDVRKVYKGKLTYGANWYEEYKEVPFWDALDYIGIQAYFPVAQSDYPSVAAMNKGWKPYKNEIKALSKRYKKPILFTEIGYKNSADGATTPWEWPESIDGLLTKASDETQFNAYEAFFDALWEEEWFAGAIFWQWRITSRHENRSKISFSPEGRAAEQSMASGFGAGL